MSQASSGRFLTFVVILGSLVALGPLSIDMYLPAFPNMADAFGVGVERIELSLASFFVGLSLGQLLYGTLTDRFGRKPPLYVGLLLFSLASLACAWAPTVDALIGLRFVQALGACAGMVVSRAMVRDLFEAQEAARVFSLLMLVMGVAPILAPLVGGYVTAHFGWQPIFWIISAVSFALLVAVFSLLPESRKAQPDVKLSQTFRTYAAIFRDRSFLGYALAGGIAQAGMFAYITGSPYVFMEHFGLSSTSYGWLFGVNAFGLITLSQLNARLARKHSLRRILNVSFHSLFVFSMVLMIAGWLDLSFWGVSIPLFLYLAFLGMTFPNTTAAALAYQGQRAGAASALLGTLQFVLAAIASTVISFFHARSPIPMTATIGACGTLALGFFYLLAPSSEQDRL